MLKTLKIYIEPRRSGKTNKLIRDYALSYNESCFIGFNYFSLDSSFNSPSNILKNVITQDFTESWIRAKQFKNIFIDEYLFFNSENMEKCNYILPYIAENIIIRTTARKLIDFNLYNLIRYARTNNLIRYLDIVSDEASFLYYNLITHPKSELYYETDYKDLSGEEIKTQILGRIFND